MMALSGIVTSARTGTLRRTEAKIVTTLCHSTRIEVRQRHLLPFSVLWLFKHVPVARDEEAVRQFGRKMTCFIQVPQGDEQDGDHVIIEPTSAHSIAD